MAALKEEPVWESEIRQLEETDPVMAGEYGVANIAPRQLANRTLYLKKELEKHSGFLAMDSDGKIILMDKAAVDFDDIDDNDVATAEDIDKAMGSNP